MIIKPTTDSQKIYFIPSQDVIGDAKIFLTSSGTGREVEYDVTLVNEKEYTTVDAVFNVKEGLEYDIRVVSNDATIYTDILFVTAQEADQYQTITGVGLPTSDNIFNMPNDE